ncbi:DNA topoisomerase IV subunit B [Nitrobacter sp. Nb-311A]|nr:DNA topoisomerase IV subunit B [Nitrobacter sp. Nb-311A]
MVGSLMMCVSVVLLLIGMTGGMAMGIEQNFTLAPAHAHLNLVGGVLLFLFGLFYRLVPSAGKSMLARIQGGLHILAASCCRSESPWCYCAAAHIWQCP